MEILAGLLVGGGLLLAIGLWCRADDRKVERILAERDEEDRDR